MKIKLTCFILPLLIIACVSSSIFINAAQAVSVGFTGEVENSRFKLTCDKSTGNISLFDKRTAQIYSGIPAMADEDSIARGLFKMELYSQLIIRGVDILTNQLTDIMSYPASVKKGDVKVEQLINGFKVTYDFSSEKIVVPLYFLIDEEKFNVRSDVAEIVEGQKVIIKDLEILPFFSAGSAKDKGFILIPDGSGAIINFNNGKGALGDYSGKIYGRDDSFYLKQQSLNTADIKMPVFGIEKNGYGFLAVVNKSDAAGKICASVSGIKTEYNNAYFGFTMHSTDTIYINKDTWYEKGVLKYNPKPEIEEISTNYYFYSEKGGSMVSMAEIYRNYIRTATKKTPEIIKNGLFIDILGSIDVNVSILGFPVNTIRPLTTFKQARQIIDEADAKDIDNISVKLSNPTYDSVKYKVKKNFTPLAKLGGSSEFEKLIGVKDIKFFPDMDIMNFDPGFLSFTSLLNGVKSLSNETATKYIYDVATYNINKAERKFGLLKPDKFENSYESIVSSAKKQNITGLSVGSFGDALYSDFNKKGIASRQQTLDKIVNVYKNTFTDMDIISNNPNSYAIPYSDALLEIPDSSSGFDIFDYDVPFYAIVVNGLCNFTYNPINLAADPQIQKLKSLSVGAMPLYKLFFESSDKVKETSYSKYFSCNYRQWLEDMSTGNEMIKEFNDISGNRVIKKFEHIQHGVERVSYENGVTVIFNYGNSDVNVDGFLAKAKSYAISQEKK